MVHKRIFTKKAPNLFWLLVEDIKVPYFFYKIQYFQGPRWASIIATCVISCIVGGSATNWATLSSFAIAFAQKASHGHGAAQ